MARRQIITGIALVLAALLQSVPATAGTLTAVCKEPIGRMLGVGGTLQKGKLVDVADGMKNGMFTIVWQTGQDRAQIVTQGSGGGDPNSEVGLKVFETEEQVSFLVLYSSALWLYSLYPGPKTLLITSHNNGAAFDAGGAMNKSFMAHCDISQT